MKLNNYKISILLFSIISLYYLSTINFISNGEIGSLGFELLQLIYCIKGAIYTFNLSDNHLKSLLLHPFIVILFVHILRFLIKIKQIINISKNPKHFILDIISLIYIYYILNNDSYNHILFGLIYYFIAVNSFSNNYNNFYNTTNLYYILNILQIPNNLLPVLIGDCLYHIYELYTYFY